MFETQKCCLLLHRFYFFINIGNLVLGVTPTIINILNQIKINAPPKFNLFDQRRVINSSYFKLSNIENVYFTCDYLFARTLMYIS